MSQLFPILIGSIVSDVVLITYKLWLIIESYYKSAVGLNLNSLKLLTSQFYPHSSYASVHIM